MKRFLFILAIFAFVFNNAYAQWTQIKGTDSVGLSIGYEVTSVAVDTIGNVYVSGLSSNTIDNVSIFKFNGHTWSSMPSQYPFVNGGSSIYSQPTMLLTDAAGYLYGATTYDTILSSSSFLSQTTLSKWTGTSWNVIPGLPSFSIITAMTSDRSGNIYVCGSAYVNSLTTTNFVAAWNGAAWHFLDTANTLINSRSLYSITTDSLGNVYTAGNLWDSINGGYVAKWNGSTWSKIGTGSTLINRYATLQSLAISPAGDIYASGAFVDSASHPYLMKWNGAAWSKFMLDSASYPAKYPITFDRAGNLYVGGTGVGHVWNGQRWSIADSIANIFNLAGSILGMTKDRNGKIYLGGSFLNIFNNNFIATWDGAHYADLSPGNSFFYNNSYAPSGIPVASDSLANVYSIAMQRYVVKWDGTKWNELGTGDKRLNATGVTQVVCDGSGQVYAMAAYPDSMYGTQTQHAAIAKWDGANWIWLLNGYPLASHDYMAMDPSGNVYVTGLPVVNNNGFDVAKWNGTAWALLGAAHANWHINALGFDTSGNVYAGGTFTDTSSVQIGNFGHYYVAKWNGSTWTHLGHLDSITASSGINSMVVDLSGNVYVTGGKDSGYSGPNLYQWVSVWNGNTWSNFGSTFYGNFLTLGSDRDNNIYALGSLDPLSLTNGIYYDYIWNGNSWKLLNNSAVNISGNGFYQPLSDRYGNWYAVNSNYGYGQGMFRYTFLSAGCAASMGQEICLVTIDTTTEKPVVIWEKANKYATDSFYIYRAAMPGTSYTQIAILNRDSLSEWTDTSAYPLLTSYRYKIGVRDTCGRMETLSPYHQTIYLTYLGAGQFSWTPYVIEDTASPVSSYALWRDSLGTGNWQLLSTIGANLTTASDPGYTSYPHARYMVVVTLANPCNPTRGLSSIRSNVLSGISTGITALNSDNIKVVPNPSHDNFTILTNMTGEETITITDMLGRIVYQATSDGPQTIKASEWISGIYSCRVQIGGISYQVRLVRN